MKNLGTLLAVVCLAAVAVLYVLFFTKNKPVSPQDKAMEKVETADVGAIKALFVDMDSVLAGYQLSNDLTAKFEADNRVRMEKLQSKQRTYENMVRQYQQKLPTMTTREAGKEEEKIARYQQEFMQDQQELEQRAAIQQQEILMQITDSLENFFIGYAARKQVDAVIGYQKGNAIYTANPKLDVTGEVIKVLNERYSAVKPKENTQPAQ